MWRVVLHWRRGDEAEMETEVAGGSGSRGFGNVWEGEVSVKLMGWF